MVDAKSIGSKRDEYPKTTNGETASTTSTTYDLKSLGSKAKGYTEIVSSKMDSSGTEIIDVKTSKGDHTESFNAKIRKPSVGENLNSQSISEDMETASDVMHSGGAAILDANDEASRKRKKKRKRKRKRKRKIAGDNKAAVNILNPHDDIEDTEIVNSVQSHVYGGQQMDTNKVISLYAKLTIEDVEIPKDQNLVDSTLKDFANHVAKSRKKLLILDVNGLLADIISPPPKDCKSDKNIKRRAIFKRPFLDGFLGFCFERFDVAIWSSRTRKILDPVVDYLLGDLKKKLLFIWDLSHCTNSSARSLENKHKVIVFKELRKIWGQNGHKYLASENGYYDESNTLLLDDSPYKAMLNPKHTGIFPLSYSYMDINDNSLGPDGDLLVYLKGVAATEDIKMYIEQHPFGQRAIDETSPHWAFYSGVLEHVP